MKRLMFVTIALSLVVAGCDKPTAQTAAAPAELPANLIVTTVPSGAVDVAAARKSAKDGERIVIKGRVAGQKEPLAANRAIMTVADLSLPTCDKTPMDTCKTPWDLCCQPGGEIAAKTISVQVVGVDGRPIKSGLSEAGGIAPLRELVVAGVVRIPADNATPILYAEQIYVVP